MAPSELSAAGNYQIGDLLLDTARQSVSRNGTEVQLPRLSYELLLALVRAHPRMLSNDELLTSVWTPAIVNSETVSQRVKLLRYALGDDAQSPRYIERVRGRGYRLAAPVSLVSPQEPTQSSRSLGAGSPVQASPRPRRRVARLLLLTTTAVVVLLVAGFAFWFRRTMHVGAGPVPPPSAVAALAGRAGPLNPKSIAVLPFLDLSEKNDEGFFADGMTEEITSLLSQVADLRVSARTSAFYFKDRSMPIGQIGNALGAANVLEGSVRKAGPLIRVTVQLIRTDTGYHLWSASYDRRPDDLFGTQTEIARSVVSHLQVSLAEEESRSRRDLLSSNLKARNLYLAAGMSLRSETRAGLHEALAQLQSAVSEDPQFAQAWALLAFARLQTTIYDDAPAVEVTPRVTQAAERALAIDPTLADAHVVEAQLLGSDWNIRAALTEAHRALDTDPNNVGALLTLAQLEQLCGHYEESIRLGREVVRRDPLNSSSYVQLAQTLWFAGHEQEAIETDQTALMLNPSAAFYHFQLAVIQLTAGDVKAALDSVELGNDDEERAILHPVMLDALGRHAEAEREQQIAEKRFGGPACHDLAIFYARRGDADHAMPLLEQCYRNHDFYLPLLKGDPLFRKLRPNPRFEAMIRRFDIPE
jgi:TolB-like protein/DNA-binding winged helix-turn-helix (wHTH) protein/tetratricopeptide (TPR) repeat protein